jgi:hypothetical protein
MAEAFEDKTMELCPKRFPSEAPSTEWALSILVGSTSFRILKIMI